MQCGDAVQRGQIVVDLLDQPVAGNEKRGFLGRLVQGRSAKGYDQACAGLA